MQLIGSFYTPDTEPIIEYVAYARSMMGESPYLAVEYHICKVSQTCARLRRAIHPESHVLYNELGKTLHEAYELDMEMKRRVSISSLISWPLQKYYGYTEVKVVMNVMYYTIRILLLQCLSDVLVFLKASGKEDLLEEFIYENGCNDQEATKTGGPPEPHPLRLLWIDEMRELAEEISNAVPFCVGEEGSRSEQVERSDGGIAMRAYLITWPLRVALDAPGLSPRSRAKITKQLSYIGKTFGIGIATAIAADTLS
jgi:hypothetical protein